MENFNINVLSEQFILDHFAFNNSDDVSNERFELSTYLVSETKHQTTICFEACDGKISKQQILTFNNFIDTLKTETNGHKITKSQYLYKAYSLKERKLAQNGEILMKVIDRIIVPYQINDYDLIVICSHYFKQFWRKEMRVTIRVECLNNEIKSPEQKNDINIPNDHAQILKHFSTNFYSQCRDSDDIYYDYNPFLKIYLDKLNQN